MARNLAEELGLSPEETKAINDHVRKFFKTHNAQGSTVSFDINKHSLEEDHFIKQLIKYGSLRTDAWSDYYFIGSLFILSIVSDRKIVMKLNFNDVYTNIWGFILGGSSLSRKSTVVGHVTTIASNVRNIVPLPNAFSPESFVEKLSENPQNYYTKDEAGQLLASMGKSYMDEMRDMMADLFDCPDYRHRFLRTSRKAVKNSFEIENVYISQLLATTDNTFSEYTKAIDLLSGWLIRYLYVYPKGDREKRGFSALDPESTKMETELIGRMHRLARWIDERYTIKQPLEMVFSDVGMKYFNEWQLSLETKYENNKIASALIQRYQVYAVKIAMLYALGSSWFEKEIVDSSKFSPSGVVLNNFMHKIVIPDDYVKLSCEIVEKYFIPTGMTVIRMVALNTSKNMQNKMISILDEYNGKIPLRDMYRELHVSKKTIMEAIEALGSEGSNEIDCRPDENGVVTIYKVMK